MNRLIFDTATSGKWIYGSKIQDEIQPHMVRLSWSLEDEAGETIRDTSHLIRLPAGVAMEQQAAHVTGVYQHKLEEYPCFGLFEVLTEFADALGEAGLVIAFGWSGQKQVLERSFRYVGMPAREWPPHFDAMMKATNVVKIPSDKIGALYKWPTFNQANEFFAGRQYMPSGNPISDGLLRVRCVRTFYLNTVEQLEEAPQPED